ncbi:hypothetical protein WJX84_011311 [Apatococcus fuscideae]|uniref:Fcf2 pre-rRNA processing C-terminal domain-containing protein n=1 Tax=Apatococcus fuscideae TaxID=2026836 RepID=A0AAW1T835_9CHLO
MVSLRSREVDSDSQATSGFKGTRTRSQKPSGGRSASLADTAQTPSRRSARLRGISEGEGHGSAASTPPLPSPELQSASQGAPPANSPKKPARSTRSTTKKECRNSDQAKDDSSHSEAESDDSSMGDSPASDAVQQLTAAMWNIFGQQPPGSATPDGRTPLPPVGAAAAAQHPVRTDAEGVEPQDIVEMHWHENGWMPPAPDADAAELTMVNKKQEAMASKLLIPLRDTAREKWERKQQETATAGSGWFNMKSSELNAETKRDLQLLKLRGAYDPKRFYKSSDHKRGFPAHFQMGTVVEGPTEFFSSRLTKRERQQNITQELLHDPDMNDARKRRFGKIQAELALGILSWIQTRTWLGIAASLCLVFSPSK